MRDGGAERGTFASPNVCSDFTVGKSDDDWRQMHERRCMELQFPVLGGVSEFTRLVLEASDERVGFVFSMLLGVKDQS